ncbi:hypothetical protein PKHYL_24760 [Psychrobacter sp. KH172YL61]|uniref:hypothetical protein n=1 Tax=Psychrobacter sp. KH172YL61 TaxID=2517899 RepID=UPI0010B998C2|nr:hypothetical protein PKHYL_24760 [Psychrobacter sp. KH172YL61]
MTAQNMNSQNSATSTDQADRSMTIDTVAANDNAVTNISINDHSDSDNGVDLSAVFEPYFRPDANTIVCGALNEGKSRRSSKSWR